MLSSLSPRSLFLSYMDPALLRTAEGKLSAKEMLKKRIVHAAAAIGYVGFFSGLCYLSFRCAISLRHLPNVSCYKELLTNAKVISDPTKWPCLIGVPKAIAAGLTAIFFALLALSMNTGKDNTLVKRTVYHLKGVWDPRIPAQEECDKLAEFGLWALPKVALSCLMLSLALATVWSLPQS